METELRVIGGEGRAPRLKCPPKSCECHSHIYGPADLYPRIAGRHPPYLATVDAYDAMLKRLGIERAVIVQPALYGRDNRATLDAIRALGLDRARGIAVTRPDVGKGELSDLHEAGIRGMRFYLLAGDLTLKDAPDMARRIAPFGWHIQVQAQGHWMEEAMPQLAKLPVDVVVDHVGRTPADTGVQDKGFQALLRFMETGRCWVKISAPYLSSLDGPPKFADLGPRIRALAGARPDRLVWAANWPHPGHEDGKRPEEADALDILLDWVADAKTRDAIMADNPAKLYGFD